MKIFHYEPKSGGGKRIAEEHGWVWVSVGPTKKYASLFKSIATGKEYILSLEWMHKIGEKEEEERNELDK